MARYRYVVDEDALAALLTIEDQSIALLLPHIEAIAEQPFARADYYSLDDRGRLIASRVAGDFLIGYWSEHTAHTVYILRIDRLTPDDTTS